MFLIIFSFAQAVCNPIVHRQRPKGVPIEASWAGGLDGEGWVHCSMPSRDYNECTIYDEEGRGSGPNRYALRSTGLAATQDQLRYTYVTSKAIGLKAISNWRERRITIDILSD